MAEVVLLALGHPERSDDGFGERLLHRFESHYRLPPGLLCLYGGHRPMAHYPRIAGCRWLILLDAVQVDGASGVQVVDPLPAPAAAHPLAVHQLGAAELLELLQALGEAPARVSLIGAPFESLDWGAALSPALGSLLPEACEALATLLRRGGIAIVGLSRCMS